MAYDRGRVFRRGRGSIGGIGLSNLFQDAGDEFVEFQALFGYEIVFGILVNPFHKILNLCYPLVEVFPFPNHLNHTNKLMI